MRSDDSCFDNLIRSFKNSVEVLWQSKRVYKTRICLARDQSRKHSLDRTSVWEFILVI